jgi:tRNA(Ile)-lysidine synthase
LFPHWEKPALFLAETQRLTADFIKAEALERVKWRSREGAFVTGAGAFFSQPGIVREEALFRLIDDYQLKGKGSAVPRRASLRLFTQGKFPAMDLGPVRVLRKGDQIVLSPGRGPAPEEGFALLIKRPGIYRLKGLFVEVVPSSAAAGEPPGKGDTKVIRRFFAGLPLVLRRSFQNDCIINAKQGRRGYPPFMLDREGASRYTGTVTAEDAKGPAAVIGADGKVLFRREEGAAEFFFIVSGGINV